MRGRFLWALPRNGIIDRLVFQTLSFARSFFLIKVAMELLITNRFEEIAAQLVLTANGFHARGWVLGTSGNLSAVIDRRPLRLAMTPSGADKGALCAEQILIIDEQTRVISDNKSKPSDEAPLHVRVVKELGASAVFHTHLVWSTMLSDLHAGDGGLAISGYEMLKGLEGVKTHEHSEWLPILENSQDMVALADSEPPLSVRTRSKGDARPARQAGPCRSASVRAG